MQLLYGTGNPAKMQHMRNMLAGLEIDLIGLNDLNLTVKVEESGKDPLENARIKALAYYRATNRSVFSCDSGLYIEGLDDDKQPGVYIRRVDGRELTDEEMIDYYSNLAEQLGGEVVARYRNSICFILDEEHIYEYDGDDIASHPFLIASTPHKNRKPGFPLDSLSVEIESGKYYMDLEQGHDNDSDDSLTNGFKEFFSRVLNTNVR